MLYGDILPHCAFFEDLDQILQLIRLCRQFNESVFVTQCEKLLCRQVNKITASTLLLYADSCDLAVLRTVCIGCICRHYLELTLEYQDEGGVVGNLRGLCDEDSLSSASAGAEGPTADMETSTVAEQLVTFIKSQNHMYALSFNEDGAFVP